MANSIGLATKFQPILDELYKNAALTAFMDSTAIPIEFAGANVVKIFKTSVVGLGTYSRLTGYPVGDVTASWETLTLACTRGREFNIDRMDDEETLGQAFGTLAAEFIRTQVAPEVDAYRFAKYAGTTSIAGHVAATLSSTTVLAAIDVAALAMDEAEVPPDGRVLFVSSTVNSYIKAAVTRMLGSENTVDRRVAALDGLRIISVPQSRFYTEVTLDAGASGAAGGYVITSSTGKNLNFLMVYPPAVVQATKLAQLKIFSPEENQDMDGWKIQYRLYHDAFVPDNKVNGIYAHHLA